ncbi:MAG: leishmanolysin-related zinc metalloendopeptidase [Gemmatimonadota bacterium]
MSRTRVRFFTSAALLAAVGCRQETAAPRIATAVENSAAATIQGTVNTQLVVAPSFVVRDAQGNPVGGIAVSVAVTEGGGTLTGAPVRSSSGPTAIGRWTLGTRAGQNAVTVTVAGLPPLVITATGTPAAPTQLRVITGSGQLAFAGAPLPQPVIIEVADQFGNGVPGVSVSFQPVVGGGSFTPNPTTTGDGGRTGAVGWTLGTAGRVHSARAVAGAISVDLTATVLSDFAIEVRFLNEPVAAVRKIFENAADRIRALITGDIPDAQLVNFATRTRCGLDFGPLNETVDDLLILADVPNIDGPGGVLGQAGPCALRLNSGFPAVGVMRFDQADMNNLIASGRFDAVVLHEMLHVIGVGTIWSLRGLLADAGTSDPRFTGVAGVAACNAAGFGTHCGVGGIPVENSGGGGTRDSHWRESIFDRELMTGFAEATPDMPLSAITLGSLEDFGYTVNYLAADAFTFTSVFQRTIPQPGQAAWDEVILPQVELLPDGTARTILRSPPIHR